VEGEVGEIWVSSPATVDEVRRTQRYQNQNALNVQLSDHGGITADMFANTGDLGFLWPSKVPNYKTNGMELIDGHLLFVVGKLADVVITEVVEKGMSTKLYHHPVDIELTIENAHSDIEACVVFHSTFHSGLVAVVELKVPERQALNCLPIVANSVLDEHQLCLGTVIFTKPGGIPRSSEQEKYRSQARVLFEGHRLDYHSKHTIN
jgi:acyl-CoA synthetase (AMP-forming)/AMP-acid ligase II